VAEKDSARASVAAVSPANKSVSVFMGFTAGTRKSRERLQSAQIFIGIQREAGSRFDCVIPAGRDRPRVRLVLSSFSLG